MAVIIPQVVTEDRASGALVIDGSLRFDKSKSQYLTRTPGSAGNRKKSTISYWIKRTIPVANFNPTTASVFGVGGGSSWFDISYYTIDEMQIVLDAGVGSQGTRTQASYRDFSNWYHVCVVVDTDRTNDDGANSRTRIWVNGKETVQKATGSGQPPYGQFTFLNDSGRAHYIGRDGRTSSIRYGDNYLAQFYIVDGLVLGPDHFGYYDPLTDVWRPKKFTADGTTINDGRSWSGTSSVSNNNGNANGAGSLAAVFNGTMTANGSNAYGFTTGAMDFTWTPNTPIPFGSQVRVWTGFSGGTIYLNGTEEIVTTNNNAWTTLTNGRSGKITSIRFVGGSGGGWWAGVEVDGVVLVDSTTQNLDFGTNGCYLPLDGNSPIGQDQSGKGNNWTPVNFGGSNTIEKATGAKPILNTLGGTIPKSGVFGSGVSKSYTILGTSGGGNPYVFEDLGNRPQLSFIRGATYTFDWSAASSHPLRFATAADAAGSTEYTDGTDVTGNVTTITVPHDAPDTLYYYCNVHGGMGNSISVTTDETKADPYAWKCVFAAPLVGNNLDVSNQINCTSTTKATTTSGASADYSDSNFYGGSYAFDGSNDYVKTDANSADFNFGSGDFTLECWVNADGAASKSLFSLWDYQNGQRSWNLYVNSNTQVVLITSINGGNQSDVVGPTANTRLTLNKWTHVAVTKESNTYMCFIDGVLKESNSVTETIYNNTNDPIYIGCTNGVTEFYDGNIQDVRIYKGVAKYTSNFIPAATNPDVLPDTPSGVATKTQLTKIPSSDSNTLLFPTQGSKIVLGNQYTPIDGTGDYTISFWFFASEYNSADNNGPDGGFDYILTQAATHPTYPIGITISKAGKIVVQDSGNFGSTWLSTFDYAGNYDTDHSIALGQWSYVHVVRSSGTLSIYNNGNLQYSRSQSSSSPTPTGDITICLNTGSCFVKDFRIEGAAITDPTPPTGSPTATGNTRLLLDGLNDVSGNNVALTVTGDVQRDKLSPFITTDINTVRGQEGSYCTWNPLTKTGGTLSEGNLKFVGSSSWQAVKGTFSVSSGKWYYEATTFGNTYGTAQGNVSFGIGWYKTKENTSTDNVDTASHYANLVAFSNNGWWNNFGAMQSSVTSTTAGDVIGVALDKDNNTFEFYKNGISILSGNLANTTDDLSPWNNCYYTDSFYESNFGQKPFKFPPPDGYQPLTSSTVRPDTVISRPDQYVRTTLYTGDDNDGRTITLGHEADLVWVKGRNAAAGHLWQDTVRGPGQTVLATHSSALQTTETYGQISAFTKNGITVTSGSTGDENINYPSRTYVAWSWKAGGSKGTFNVDDAGYATAAAAGLSASGNSWDSDPTGASIGTKQGFSIIKHSGTGSTGSLPHGLTQKPDLLITKAYNGTTGNWNVYTDLFDGSYDYMYFNDNAHKGDSSLSAFTSELFYYGYTTNDYIHYLWHSVPGLQKFGVYTGNSSTNFVSLDFRPALIWVKRAVANSSSDTSTNNSAWTIMDSTRLSYNGLTPNHLYSDWTAAEGRRGDGSGTTGLTDMTLEPMSNGFYLNGPATETNSNTGTFLYCAWAAAPAFNLYGAFANAR